MIARILPKGSTTAAVTKPWPRSCGASSCSRAEGKQAVEGGLYVVDMPVDDCAGGAGSGVEVGDKAAVDDAQLVLVVAKAKFAVAWAHEVGFHA